MYKNYNAQFIYNNKLSSSIFDINSNPDGLKDPWISLKNELAKYGINLNGQVYDTTNPPIFRLYLDYPKIQINNDSINYLVQAESTQVHLLNENIASDQSFSKIFTWDDSLVDNKRYVKCNLGNRLKKLGFVSFENRSIFCSMIAANKALPKPYHTDYYLERQKTIKWFEKHALNDFALYGLGWNIPDKKPNLTSKVTSKILRRIISDETKIFHPSWKGRVESKAEVLNNSKFTIAYENVGGLSGYITEKIFDAFVSGCVPVYWGANNIEKYIPSKCFIDRRNFKNNADLYKFLKSVDTTLYAQYQGAITEFLKGPKSMVFSAEFFAKIITESILSDLNL